MQRNGVRGLLWGPEYTSLCIFQGKLANLSDQSMARCSISSLQNAPAKRPLDQAVECRRDEDVQHGGPLPGRPALHVATRAAAGRNPAERLGLDEGTLLLFDRRAKGRPCQSGWSARKSTIRNGRSSSGGSSLRSWRKSGAQETDDIAAEDFAQAFLAVAASQQAFGDECQAAGVDWRGNCAVEV